jgi:hypothetical protein
MFLKANWVTPIPVEHKQIEERIIDILLLLSRGSRCMFSIVLIPVKYSLFSPANNRIPINKSSK